MSQLLHGYSDVVEYICPMTVSLISEVEEKEKFSVDCMQPLQVKLSLSLIILPIDWLIWFTSDNCARLFLPKMDNHNICVVVSVKGNCVLSAGYIHDKLSPFSLNSVTGIRQTESLLSEIF